MSTKTRGAEQEQALEQGAQVLDLAVAERMAGVRRRPGEAHRPGVDPAHDGVRRGIDPGRQEGG